MNTTMLQEEIRKGNRYGFGANWLKFLERIDEQRIDRAGADLRTALRVHSLEGKTFLDIGSGSGLSSLAALRLGADVISFDYDPDSVRATTWLRARFAPGCPTWKVLQGSVLDSTFMGDLPNADVVYSWGVLHHTGDMLQALRMAAAKVDSAGLLCIALYRRTVWDPLWKIEKHLYSRAPESVRAMVRKAWILKTRLSFAIKGQDFERMLQEYGRGSSGRGMDFYRDVDDWLGGYPYESISPSECRAYLTALGFDLVRETILGEQPSWALASGCDEWLFRKSAQAGRGLL